MKTFSLLITIIVSFSLAGCPGETDEGPDAILTLKNSYSGPFIYPCDYNSEQLLPNRFPDIPDYIRLEPLEIAKIPIHFSALKDHNKLWILIIKQSTLDSHTWEEIKAQGLYDKRYEFTLAELQAMNYQITYDGN